MDVTLRFDFADDLSGKVVFRSLESPLHAGDARFDASGIKSFNGLVMQSLLKFLSKLAGCRGSVPGLFGHRSVNDLAYP